MRPDYGVRKLCIEIEKGLGRGHSFLICVYYWNTEFLYLLPFEVIQKISAFYLS